ncbi:hypothetical protein K8B33_14290 [Alcanivorax sp. JB21]|uniref:hypothetical protein n=1 Tax=Alcanivorax limicola TaxID=2874102 RepID=UPI001CC0DC18|nr:hypothetical protein [Alcanivorax limicola]MBZ2190275.1 hypothetical protein [Alcanivorax limicola]
MASDALKSAQECLAIQAVHLSHCYANVRQDFDPARYNKDELVSQGFSALQSVDALEFEEDASGYRFVYLLGFRLVGKEEDQEVEGYVPKLEIVGSFSAKYKCKRKLNGEEIEAFSKNNVAYHIWPYWREYIQSTAARVGLKEVIEVPMYRIT